MTVWNQTLNNPQWQIDITPRSNAIPWYPIVFLRLHSFVKKRLDNSPIVPTKNAQISVGQILILASICPKSQYFWLIFDDSNVPEIKKSKAFDASFFFFPAPI